MSKLIHAAHEYRSLSVVYGVYTTLSHILSLQPCQVWIRLYDGPSIDCRRTKVAFDCTWQNVGECDFWMLDGEGLVQE